MFTRDVAWATCQCIPVPGVVAGMLIVRKNVSANHCLQNPGFTYCRVSITKFLTERKLDVEIEQNPEIGQRGGNYKLFVGLYH